MQERNNLLNKSFSDLTHFYNENNIPEVLIRELFREIYRKPNLNMGEVLTSPLLSKKFITLLEKDFFLSLPKITKVSKSNDHTVKFLIEFSDGESVETVLIPFKKRYTVCLSSQVGCAMNCSFCYTGTQGYRRNLKTSEIVGQYLLAWSWLKENFSNDSIQPQIVFMGQGEPLQNFENIKKSIEIFQNKWGLGLGFRNITLSTVGYLPGIKRFAELGQINFALSLHSPFNSVRSNLIPINNQFPIEDILQEIKKIPLRNQQFINIEYLLIKDLNDDQNSINKLSELFDRKRFIFNIIPFNPFPGSKYKRPNQVDVIEFKKNLTAEGFFCKMRTTKGDDILAACGQLKITHGERNALQV